MQLLKEEESVRYGKVIRRRGNAQRKPHAWAHDANLTTTPRKMPTTRMHQPRHHRFRVSRRLRACDLAETQRSFTGRQTRTGASYKASERAKRQEDQRKIPEAQNYARKRLKLVALPVSNFGARIRPQNKNRQKKTNREGSAFFLHNADRKTALKTGPSDPSSGQSDGITLRKLNA